MSNANRLIVLTGATRGLGRAMLDEFAAAGHRICACARNADAVAALRRDFPAQHFAVVDVADDAAVAGWADEVAASAGVPDLLINNAALMNPPAPLWQVGAAAFGALIDVNVKGVANLIRHFVPPMVAAGRGVIVNFSSGWGRGTSPQVAPYCASKWAIEGLSRALAQELPAGMACVPLNPGIIDTEMLRAAWGEDAGNYEGPASWARRAVPQILRLGPRHNGKPASID